VEHSTVLALRRLLSLGFVVMLSSKAVQVHQHIRMVVEAKCLADL
jgi:hypothetical protein